MTKKDDDKEYGPGMTGVFFLIMDLLLWGGCSQADVNHKEP